MAKNEVIEKRCMECGTIIKNKKCRRYKVYYINRICDKCKEKRGDIDGA